LRKIWDFDLSEDCVRLAWREGYLVELGSLGVINAQREALKPIWGLSVTVNTLKFSFKRAHSGVFIGPFIVHNTLRN
jgi:hypothetical protein